MAENKKSSGGLEAAMDRINKIHGLGTLNSGTSVQTIERLSSGSLSLDIVLGGGYGKGRIVEIYGPESSGKTTLAIHAMVQAQKAEPDKKVGIIDSEHALDSSYCKKLGLDMNRVVICQSDNGEQAFEVVEALIESGEINFILIDSIAALTPKAEIEGDMDNSAMGSQARLMSKGLRKITGLAAKRGTVLYFTNQLRDKIGIMFGNPETTTGGNSMKFYATQRIDIRKKQGATVDEEVRNIIVTCKIVKNKLAPPFRKCTFDIVFGKGVDKASEILTIAEHIGLVKKSGSWYSYGETRLGQGAESVKELLRDNLELMDELEGIIRNGIGQIDLDESEAKV